jgi:hypothetical protein
MRGELSRGRAHYLRLRGATGSVGLMLCVWDYNKDDDSARCIAKFISFFRQQIMRLTFIFLTFCLCQNRAMRRTSNDDSVVQEQILLRENAIEQSDLLMEYKQLFVKHPSHHYAFKNNYGAVGGGQGKANASNDGSGTGLLSIFTSLLAEPLSKTGSSRTSSDHLTIELVLHLIRNLLCISPLNTFGSTETSQRASQLHRELLVVLQEEMVLDVLVCVGQEVERRENSGYNLLLMEILSCLLKGQVCTSSTMLGRLLDLALNYFVPFDNSRHLKRILRMLPVGTTGRIARHPYRPRSTSSIRRRP